MVRSASSRVSNHEATTKAAVIRANRKTLRALQPDAPFPEVLALSGARISG
jgi:hypothetical protein